MEEIQTSSIFYPRPGRPDKSKRLDFLSADDYHPPVTVITGYEMTEDGKLRVWGTSVDNGKVARVVVNGESARLLDSDSGEWIVSLPASSWANAKVEAYAMDAADNREATAHIMKLPAEFKPVDLDRVTNQ